LIEGFSKDFVLKLQWRFEKTGNSGVLVRMTGDDKVWPKSCEALLASGRAGDSWLIDGFKLETPRPSATGTTSRRTRSPSGSGTTTRSPRTAGRSRSR
jgi:hypothetical protein